MDARTVRANFDYSDAWRELDENSVEHTTRLACHHCSWHDQDANVSRVEARASEHLEDQHPERLSGSAQRPVAS